MRSVREALTASRRAPLLSALGVVTIAFSLFAFELVTLGADARELVALRIHAGFRALGLLSRQQRGEK